MHIYLSGNETCKLLTHVCPTVYQININEQNDEEKKTITMGRPTICWFNSDVVPSG